MGFIGNPEAYDIILMGGRKIPGEAHLEGEVIRELAKQHKRGSGDDGAAAHFRGLKPADFTITSALHTDEDEADWAALLPRLIDLNNSSNRNQLSVVHPQLARLGISVCIIHHIGERAPRGGDPIIVTIKCSSVKVKAGGSNKPKPTKQFISTTAQVYRVNGSHFAQDYGLNDQPYFYADLSALKDRQPSALEQARTDNGVAFSDALANRQTTQ